jgi:phosphoesterase RecJ-like protein
LAHWESITQVPRGSFDLIISLDCSDLQRLGTVYDAQAFAGTPIVNIDHHTTNVHFGTVNWVEPSAAATSQMIAGLLRAMNVPLDVDIATCLLNGVLTDTLGFRTSGTTPQVMQVAIDLMNAGASLSALTDRIFNHRPLGTIRMWSRALQEIHLDDRIVWSQITRDMRQSVGLPEDGVSGLVSFLSTADEADIAVVFDELEGGEIKVSMRAIPGTDVSQVALALGGGGHAQAAGCTIRGPLETARSKVLSMLRQSHNVRT